MTTLIMRIKTLPEPFSKNNKRLEYFWMFHKHFKKPEAPGASFGSQYDFTSYTLSHPSILPLQQIFPSLTGLKNASAASNRPNTNVIFIPVFVINRVAISMNVTKTDLDKRPISPRYCWVIPLPMLEIP